MSILRNVERAVTIHCGHGFKRELEPYRHVRIFEMNCGEVRCSLSERDYFAPQYIRKWIDAALDGKKRDKWLELDALEVLRAQQAEADSRRASASTDPPGQHDGGLPQ